MHDQETQDRLSTVGPAIRKIFKDNADVRSLTRLELRFEGATTFVVYTADGQQRSIHLRPDDLVGFSDAPEIETKDKDGKKLDDKKILKSTQDRLSSVEAEMATLQTENEELKSSEKEREDAAQARQAKLDEREGLLEKREQEKGTEGAEEGTKEPEEKEEQLSMPWTLDGYTIPVAKERFISKATSKNWLELMKVNDERTGIVEAIEHRIEELDESDADSDAE